MLSLEKLLDGLDLAVEPFAVCRVGGGRPLDLGRRDDATIHFTLTGRGFIRLADGPEIAIETNTVLIVPARRSHRLATRAAASDAAAALPCCVPLGPGWEAVFAGDGEDPAVAIACAALHATYQRAHGLFDYLDEPLVERLDEADPIRQTLAMLIDEQRRPQVGSRALCQSLMRQCLILLLRRHCADGHCTVPWLTALEDERLGRAVAAIFERPEAAHSLERLAGLAGMSRSAFAEHFAQAFGRGPMDLVREVRLRRAAHLLKSSDLPVKSLAHGVGYQSRSQFSRAFKAFFGRSPAEFREKAPAAVESEPAA